MLAVTLGAELARFDLRPAEAHLRCQRLDLISDEGEQLGMSGVANVFGFFVAQEHQFLPVSVKVGDSRHDAAIRVSTATLSNFCRTWKRLSRGERRRV